jgi:hypothetical protein
MLRLLRAWRDNSYWHHRMANSRHWWRVCGDCRKVRGKDHHGRA